MKTKLFVLVCLISLSNIIFAQEIKTTKNLRDLDPNYPVTNISNGHFSYYVDELGFGMLHGD